MKPKRLYVVALTPKSTRGIIRWSNGHSVPCALGRSGRRRIKREGDGATPIGSWPIDQVYYRHDRVKPPGTKLAARPIQPNDGWCDDPTDPNYNRPVKRPYNARHEPLSRADHVYNLLLILNYNRRPRLPNRGSAIFCHLARPNFEPTEGCIALKERDLRLVLLRSKRGDLFVVRA